MSFTATGVSARKNRDQTITVVVQISGGQQGHLHGRREFTGPHLEAVRALIQTDLDARAAAETDVALNQAVAGIVLATST